MDVAGAVREDVRGADPDDRLRLRERLQQWVGELGASVAAEPRGPLVCVRSTDAPALVAALDADGIVTSERDSNLRVSLHLYNVESDIDAVLDALKRHRHLLA